MSKSNAAASGQALWSKMPKANAALFALTYGSLVTEVLKDFDDYGSNSNSSSSSNTVNSATLDSIHVQLEQMGYSMGVRCVDEFLAKSEQAGLVVPPCTTLQETADVLAKMAIRMMLGIQVDVVLHNNNTTSTTNAAASSNDANAPPQSTQQAAANTSFSLLFQDNPLALFVELPDRYKRTNNNNDGGLQYSIIYCGMIRGALEQVNLKVKCTFVKDMLQGDNCNEIKVELQQVLVDGAGDDYKEE